jgi:DNA mismatch repair protein MutS2
VVQKLNEERAALALAREAALEREREAEAAKMRFETALEEAREKQRHAMTVEARDLMDRLRRAREELRSAQARLRSKRVDADALREAERAIERVTGEVAIGGPLDALVHAPAEEPRAAVQPALLRKGRRVWVPRLRAEAEVIELRAILSFPSATTPATSAGSAWTTGSRWPRHSSTGR